MDACNLSNVSLNVITRIADDGMTQLLMKASIPQAKITVQIECEESFMKQIHVHYTRRGRNRVQHIQDCEADIKLTKNWAGAFATLQRRGLQR